MNRIIQIIAVCAALVSVSQNVQGQGALRREFVTHAPPKWEAYRSFARRLQGFIDVNMTTFDASGAVESNKHSRFQIKQNANCALVSYQGVSTRRHRVYALNGKYAFQLGKQEHPENWILDGLDVFDRMPRDKSEIAGKALEVNQSTCTHLNVYALELSSDLLAKSNFTIMDVRRVDKDASKLIRVEFDYPRPLDINKFDPVRRGWFILDVDNFYCIREYEVTGQYTDGTGKTTARFHYDRNEQGYPVLTRMVSKVISHSSKRSVDDSWEYHLDEASTLPPDKEFTLSAFGLPEPKGIVWESGSTSYLWFIAAGIAALSVGYVLRTWLRRTKAARAAPIRPGFTLIELLVVIAIIGILIALIIPAVQKVRAAALRVDCLNNLKQIGLAAHQYHDTAKAFPPGLHGADPMRFSSWLAAILPYIEQDALWRTTQDAYQQSASPFHNPPHVGLATVIRTYSCAADGRAEQPGFAPIDKFFVGLTNYLGVSGKDLTSLDGIFFRDSRIRLGDVSDGTSQTLLAGERPPSANLQFGWWYAGVGQKYTGSADMILGVEEQNALPIVKGGCPPGTYTFAPGNISDQCDMFHFWSLHSGGANFLFADGSVRFLSYSAAPIMPALASRAGNDLVGSMDY